MTAIERHIGREEHLRLHRRAMLRCGAVATGGWLTGLSQRLARAAESGDPGAPPRSLIVLWLQGGPSQLETFDPHPGTMIAGGTEAIATAASGVKIAADYPRLAEQMASVALVRSMQSAEGDHERGTYLAKTGYRPDPVTRHPTLGAIVCHELPRLATDIPRHVSILPGNWPDWGGYLGDSYNAFKMPDPRYDVPDVRSSVSRPRLEKRLDDLAVVERAFAAGRGRQVDGTHHRETIERARRMMASEQLAAFQIDDEPAELRERYGDTPFGRGCLAARRLTEVGVRCVEVTLGGWDTHVDNHSSHTALAGTLDAALSALISDLAERDRLDHTLVLCAGEFGRTPTINRLGGRDHWPHGFTVALAGCGIRGGTVVGATDPEGGRKVEDAQTFPALGATLLTALGIDPSVELISPAGRPIKLADAEPIGKLLG
ncbi:MAG: DUF1501 domain-containing protein [Pirellulales bacterium]|nr:DUF1501 domain-containing protein [Planctomycetales bacterium]